VSGKRGKPPETADGELPIAAQFDVCLFSPGFETSKLRSRGLLGPTGSVTLRYLIDDRWILVTVNPPLPFFERDSPPRESLYGDSPGEKLIIAEVLL